MKKIFLICLMGISLFGVPAYQGEKEFTQNDGKSFKGYLKGDEYFSWIQTKTGHTAKYNRNSRNYEYMILSAEDNLLFSSIKVNSSNLRSNVPGEIKIISTEQLGKLWKKAWQKRHEY